jgi:hypothetical protein
MRTLVDDIERFADTWVSNPAARLDFAKLIERALELGDDDAWRQLREWIREEKQSAKRLGIG